MNFHCIRPALAAVGTNVIATAVPAKVSLASLEKASADADPTDKDRGIFAKPGSEIKSIKWLDSKSMINPEMKAVRIDNSTLAVACHIPSSIIFFSLTASPNDEVINGSKIGVDVEDSMGREWTVGTVQVDFNIPRELDLSYTSEEGTQERHVMVHRAILGSYERFMG